MSVSIAKPDVLVICSKLFAFGVSSSMLSAFRRKKEQVLSMLKEHSEEELMQRLESGLEQPARPEHRLASLIPVLSFLSQINAMHSIRARAVRGIEQSSHRTLHA